MSDERICVKCKWHHSISNIVTSIETHICRCPMYENIDYVTGKKKYPLCNTLNNDGRCFCYDKSKLPRFTEDDID